VSQALQIWSLAVPQVSTAQWPMAPQLTHERSCAVVHETSSKVPALQALVQATQALSTRWKPTSQAPQAWSWLEAQVRPAQWAMVVQAVQERSCAVEHEVSSNVPAAQVPVQARQALPTRWYPDAQALHS
jgi:hypothetical protein